MYLIQLLLPLYDNSGRRFPRAKLANVRLMLTRHFGGVTIYSRAPAEGLSKEGDEVVRDDVIIFEVMTPELSSKWWGAYRARLEKTFKQDTIVVRASTIEPL